MRRRVVAIAAVLVAALGLTGLSASAADSADLAVSINTVWGVPNFHTAYPGGAYSFEVVAWNNGPSPAVNATLTIPVSAFLQVTVADYSGTTCTTLPDVDGNGSIVCTAPAVESGHYMAVHVTAGVPPGTPGGTHIPVSATADSDTTDPTPGNDSAGDSTEIWGAITPSTDLTGPGESTAVALPGTDFTWSVGAYNAGYEPAVHPWITVSAPDDLTLVSAEPSSSWPNSSCGTTGATLVCSTPVLLSGTGASFQLVFHVPESAAIGSTITLGATASSDTNDEDAANNGGSMSVYIGGADVDVTVAGPPTAPPGEDASYTITFGNDGPETAVNPELSLWVPWNTTYVSFDQTSGPAFDCEATNVEGGYEITCTAASLAAGASAQFTLVVTLDPDLDSSDHVSVHPNVGSESPDADGDDNSASATTSVSVLAVPTLDTFSPAYAAVGTVVTITGSALSGTTDVVFNTAHATTFTVDSDSQLHATVPKGTTTGPITVTTAAGSDTSTDELTILTAKPVVTSFTPNHGVPTATVTITGSKLTGASGVTIGGTAATFDVTSDKTISATVPNGAPAGKIAVTNAVGTTTSGAVFTVVYPPSIASFAPALGKRSSTVTLTGTGFLGTNTVTLNGVGAKFKVVSDTKLTFTVPVTATTGAIVVANDADSATSDPFTVVLRPKITSYTPHHGPANALHTTDVVISGTGFTGTTSVKLGSKPAASFTVDSDTQITATTAVGTANGAIVVKNAAGAATGKGSFVVDLPPAVTSFTPALGKKTSTLVTITGKRFTSGAVVSFGGVDAIDSVFVSATKMTATVPAGAVTGAVTVTNEIGAGSSAKAFAVIQPPAIDSFSPGSAKAGASVTINGTGFTGTTSVTFNGLAAKFTVKSDTKIVAVVPKGATTGVIRVTNAEDFAESGGPFSVLT